MNINKQRREKLLYEVIPYRTESGNVPLYNFVQALAKDGNPNQLAKIHLYESYLKQYGMEMKKIIPKSIKHIRGEIYELRPGKNRIFFFAVTTEDKFVLLHGFKKKSNTTPKEQIEKAEQEWKDYKRRY